MKWREFWSFVTSTWGIAAAVVTAGLAIYYAPKKVLETYDWYMDRIYDSKVRVYLGTQMTGGIRVFGGRTRVGPGANLEEIRDAKGVLREQSTCLPEAP